MDTPKPNSSVRFRNPFFNVCRMSSMATLFLRTVIILDGEYIPLRVKTQQSH